MAKGTEKQTQETLPTIEDLCRKHKLPSWIVAGMMQAFGWASGKRLAENDFLRAKKDWLSGPMSRR